MPHARGTVGMSTRGHDTGDAQWFVNLRDNLRLGRDYTVFGEVIEGWTSWMASSRVTSSRQSTRSRRDSSVLREQAVRLSGERDAWRWTTRPRAAERRASANVARAVQRVRRRL